MEMETRVLQIKGREVFVSLSGEGEPLLCLHGWGRHVDSHAFDPLREALKKDAVQVIAPDLPGFGKSPEPLVPWCVVDYADCVEELLQQLGLREVHLLGHSFGGRIAIKLASKQPSWLQRLYLCGAAGVGRDLLIRRRFWLCIAKMGNAFFRVPGLKLLKPFFRKILYKLLRVHDYAEASERMRKTMECVIEEDLTPLLDRIEIPTDLFWGAADTLTPLRDGELMNKRIVQSKLHVFPGVRHRVHIERAAEIAAVIRERIHVAHV